MISINTYHLACAEGSALQCYSFDYSKSMLFEQNFISSQTPLYYRIFHIRRMHNPMTANPITDVLIKDMSMFMPNPPSFLDWAVSATNDHLAASADCLIFWCFCPLCQVNCCWIHYMIAWMTSFLYWIDWSQVCMTPTLAFRLFSYCFCNASKNVIICFVQHCFLFYGVAISLGVGSERSFYIKDARHFYIPLKLHSSFPLF